MKNKTLKPNTSNLSSNARKNINIVNILEENFNTTRNIQQNFSSQKPRHLLPLLTTATHQTSVNNLNEFSQQNTSQSALTALGLIESHKIPNNILKNENNTLRNPLIKDQNLTMSQENPSVSSIEVMQKSFIVQRRASSHGEFASIISKSVEQSQIINGISEEILENSQFIDQQPQQVYSNNYILDANNKKIPQKNFKSQYNKDYQIQTNSLQSQYYQQMMSVYKDIAGTSLNGKPFRQIQWGKTTRMAKILGLNDHQNIMNKSAPYIPNKSQQEFLDIKQQLIDGGNTVQISNVIEESTSITNRDVEVWLNETLMQAEHLGIPGLILNPDHKKPIIRYGIGRQDLTNLGLPNEIVDRIYRSLYAHSIGFYELIKKVLIHLKKERNAITTRLWKVFSILLDYCCLTEYQLLINETKQMHQIQIDEIEAKMKEVTFQSQENVRKLTAAANQYQKELSQLEELMMKEQTKRLKVEEMLEFNQRDHEDEVALRLKFEQKLNNVYSTQRQSELQIQMLTQQNLLLNDKQEKYYAYSRELEALSLEQSKEISSQQVKINLYEDELQRYKNEVKVQSMQIPKLEEIQRTLTDQVGSLRYKLSRVQAEEFKAKSQIEVMQLQIKSLQGSNETLESLCEITKDEKTQGVERNVVLKTQVDEQLILICQAEEQVALDKIEIHRKKKVIDEQRNQTDIFMKQLEEVTILKNTSEMEVSQLKIQNEYLTKDFEESVDKLHTLNRYRKELEICYTAEKENNEKNQVIMIDQDNKIKELDGNIYVLNQTVEDYIKKLADSNGLISNLRGEIEQIIVRFTQEIENLKQLQKKEIMSKHEWEKKYQKNQAILDEKAKDILTLAQQISIMNLEKEEVILKQQFLERMLENEKKDRKVLERESLDRQRQMKEQANDLIEMLQVSRQLEQQRLKMNQDKDEIIKEEKIIFDSICNQQLMEIEDFRVQLVYQNENLNEIQINFKGLIKQLKSQFQTQSAQLECTQMYSEDLLTKIYYQQNHIHVLGFQIIEARDQTHFLQEKLNESLVQNELQKIKELMTTAIGKSVIKNDKKEQEQQIQVRQKKSQKTKRNNVSHEPFHEQQIKTGGDVILKKVEQAKESNIQPSIGQPLIVKSDKNSSEYSNQPKQQKYFENQINIVEESKKNFDQVLIDQKTFYQEEPSPMSDDEQTAQFLNHQETFGRMPSNKLVSQMSTQNQKNIRKYFEEEQMEIISTSSLKSSKKKLSKSFDRNVTSLERQTEIFSANEDVEYISKESQQLVNLKNADYEIFKQLTNNSKHQTHQNANIDIIAELQSSKTFNKFDKFVPNKTNQWVPQKQSGQISSQETIEKHRNQIKQKMTTQEKVTTQEQAQFDQAQFEQVYQTYTDAREFLIAQSDSNSTYRDTLVRQNIINTVLSHEVSPMIRTLKSQKQEIIEKQYARKNKNRQMIVQEQTFNKLRNTDDVMSDGEKNKIKALIRGAISRT